MSNSFMKCPKFGIFLIKINVKTKKMRVSLINAYYGE